MVSLKISKVNQKLLLLAFLITGGVIILPSYLETAFAPIIGPYVGQGTGVVIMFCLVVAILLFNRKIEKHV